MYALATIDDTCKKSGENGLGSLAGAATKRDYEIVLRQVEQNICQEFDRKLKLERMQFERKISELKDTQLRQMKQDGEKHQKEVMLMEKVFKEQIAKNRDSFFRELEQLRQQLEYMKSSYPQNACRDAFGEGNITENQPGSPSIDACENRSLSYQDESPWTNAMSQLEELLNQLEIANKLNKRNTGRADHNLSPSNIGLNHVDRSAELEKDPRKKNTEIRQLNEQAQNLEGFQPTQSRSLAGDIVINDDVQKSDAPDKIQEEIFDMIREISQEKREQKLKISAPTVEAPKLISLGSKVSKK